MVFGNFGEASQAVHQLVDALASSRARIADPQARGRKGQVLTEEGVKSLAVGYIRRRLGVAAVKAQCHSLLGRQGSTMFTYSTPTYQTATYLDIHLPMTFTYLSLLTT